MSVTTSSKGSQTWRLSPGARRVGLLVAAVLMLVVLAAAWYDVASPLERRQFPLELAGRVGKLLVAAGLAVIARRTGSVSMRLLAVLAALLAAAGLLADAPIIEGIFDGAVGAVAGVLPFSEGGIRSGALFVALGLAALALLATAWTKSRPDERPVVGTLILWFMAVGVFTGPVNAIAATGISREWLFAEDFGQAVVLAGMAGYVAGLVATSRDRR